MTTLYSDPNQDLLIIPEMSKKQISEIVYLKIYNSLSGLNLSGKKFENKLKKVSKLFAKDVAKANKKQKKQEMQPAYNEIPI